MCVKGERRSLPPQKQTVSHMGERLPCSRPVPLRLVKLRFPRLRPARHCFRSPFLSCPIAMRRGIIVPCPATPAALAVGRREGTSAICLRCYMPKRACLSGLTLQKVKAHPLWSIFVLKMLPELNGASLRRMPVSGVEWNGRMPRAETIIPASAFVPEPDQWRP